MHIMGIVNVTPDSFSDGGRWQQPSDAVSHGRELMDQGATILDIGGESTRPGATVLDWETEWQRIEPVIAGLVGPAAERGVQLSVDTYHSQTAQRAVAAGVDIVNDVTGGRADPQMFATVAQLGCDYVLQHSRGTSETMNSLAHYDDVVADVLAELATAQQKAVGAGIDPHRIILDPGLGFAKLGEDDWQILRALDRFAAVGQRVLIGASRKRSVGAIAGADLNDRDLVTAVISGYAAQHAVWAVRVHNVSASALALATLAKLGAVSDNDLVTSSPIVKEKAHGTH